MKEYKICMYLTFVSGNDPDSYYPGEDKLWLEILLDEYLDGYFDCTIDCNGIEMPLGFLNLSERERKEFINSLEDKIVEHAATLLARNGIEEFDISDKVDPNVLAIANGPNVSFFDDDFEDVLKIVREWV